MTHPQPVLHFNILDIWLWLSTVCIYACAVISYNLVTLIKQGSEVPREGSLSGMWQRPPTQTPLQAPPGNPNLWVMEEICRRLCDFQVLPSHLNFACREVRPHTIFCKHLYAATAKVLAPNHYIHINKDSRDFILS